MLRISNSIFLDDGKNHSSLHIFSNLKTDKISHNNWKSLQFSRNKGIWKFSTSIVISKNECPSLIPFSYCITSHWIWFYNNNSVSTCNPLQKCPHYWQCPGLDLVPCKTLSLIDWELIWLSLHLFVLFSSEKFWNKQILSPVLIYLIDDQKDSRSHFV